ncbi:MAG: S4 domain-containing protein, partial [Limnohabitans sp.]
MPTTMCPNDSGPWLRDLCKRMWTAFSPCHQAISDMTGHATVHTEGIRLSKRVADILKCSRAEAEQVIVGGWVKVNNRVVDEPANRVKDEQ